MVGGARGIGLAFVRALLDAGARVGIVDLPPTASVPLQELRARYKSNCQYAR